MSLRNEKIELKKPFRLKFYITLFIVFFIIFGSFIFTDFSIVDLISNFLEGFDLLFRMFLPPRWDYTPIVIEKVLETIQMAVVGSVSGALIAFPLAVISADNFLKSKTLHFVSKLVLGIFRTLPAMVIAAFFVSLFSTGPFPGVLALTLFSFGIIAKLTYESIEAIDYGQVEAMQSLGATKLEILRYGILPQVLPQFMSYTLYSFEVNVRAAAVLGYVDAGGIGKSYQLNMAWRRFDKVGMIIIIFFIVVLAIDYISSSIRRRLV